MKNKIIAVLSFIIMVVMSVSAFAEISFTDVTATDWYYDAVNYVNECKAMNGVGDNLFEPNNKMTRAMVVTVLARLANAKTDVLVTSSFEDVSFDTWYGLSVEWAKQNGIVNGVSETKFEPDTEITREQMCVMISNYLDYKNLSTPNTPKDKFADEDSISKWAYEAVQRLQYAGIVNGKDDNMFEPQGGATRAEFAQIIYNSRLGTIIEES